VLEYEQVEQFSAAEISATHFFVRFLGSTRSIEPNSYANVAGWLTRCWLAGWLSVTTGIVSK